MSLSEVAPPFWSSDRLVVFRPILLWGGFSLGSSHLGFTRGRTSRPSVLLFAYDMPSIYLDLVVYLIHGITLVYLDLVVYSIHGITLVYLDPVVSCSFNLYDNYS